VFCKLLPIAHFCVSVVRDARALCLNDSTDLEDIRMGIAGTNFVSPTTHKIGSK